MSVDNCAEIKSAPSVLIESGGRCGKAMLGVCGRPLERAARRGVSPSVPLYRLSGISPSVSLYRLSGIVFCPALSQ